MHRILARVRSFLRDWRGHAQLDAEMQDEFRLHIELRTEDLIRSGLAPGEAARRARLEFGSVERYREEGRASLGLHQLDELRGDLRYGVRSFRKSPGFTLVAVLTLGLGIGATSALFSVIHGVVLRPLEFPEPERIVRIRTLIGNDDRDTRDLSPPNFVSLAEESRAFEAMSAVLRGSQTLTGVGQPRIVESAEVSAAFFDVLGIRPVLGRSFLNDENLHGSQRVTILNEGLWRRMFGADPGMVGRVITLDGSPHTVVGVMPSGVSFPADVWVPLEYGSRFSATTDDGRFRNTWLPVLARLAPGVSLEQGREQLELLGGRLQIAFPESNADTRFTAVPLLDEVVGEARTPLLLLFGAVAVVLLVACANVTGLQLARAATRQEEMTVRVALGAGRRRLIRQLLTESLVLALLGGVLGLIVAFWSINALVAAQIEGIPRLESIRVDGVVLAFTIGVALAVGVLGGLIPALRATESALSGMLRGAGRSAISSTSGNRLRRGLVVGQIALAVVLLIGAALLLQSFARLIAVDPGFQSDRVLTFRLRLPGASYGDRNATRSFYENYLASLDNNVSVEAVGATSRLPMFRCCTSSRFSVGGRSESANQQPSIGVVVVTPGYFHALGIPLLRGRGIAEQDRSSSVPVIVINETASERFFPGEDPVGQQLTRFSYDPVEETAESFTIVGVAADVRTRGLNEVPVPEAFFAHAQLPFGDMNVVIRAGGDPTTLSGHIRNALSAADPKLPTPEFQTMERVVGDSVARPRFVAVLLTLFAGAALVLAMIGIWGVLSYTVAQRTREIGVRIALGARPVSVVRMIMRGALVMSAIGICIGVVGALALTRFLESQLFAVRATDPVTYAAVILILAGTALLAALIPARRAAAVDPIHALREG